MAQRRPNKFVYRCIELYKSQSLGSGSYGGVCKAKCDGVLCAAKIMHATLFDQGNTGRESYLGKFVEECHLISLARHPNIVQYLGTHVDPDTQLPVLLMELCEESLTAFLERSPAPLSYHVQVDICHDIVLALVYLHSNGLIHRDLTGNNVLMVSGPRAKITDFGMSRLASVNPRMTALTTCPGNSLYMPPEALDETTLYTAKLDIFSFGVLIIQIVTRLFPNPTDRFRLVSVPQFEEPLRQEISEDQRRSAHLKLIPDTHSLKQLALHCLKKKEMERKSALQLSETLSDLKRSSQYTESVDHAKSNTKVEELREQLQQQGLLAESQAKEIDNHVVRIAELEMLLEHKERELKARDTEQKAAIELKDRIIQEREQQLRKMEKERKAAKSRKSKSKQNSLEKSGELEHDVGDWQLLDWSQVTFEPSQPYQQAPELESDKDQQNKPADSKRTTKLRKKRTGFKDHDLDTTNSIQQPTIAGAIGKDVTQMKWRKGKNAPEAIKRGAAVAHGNIAYFQPSDSAKVYVYQSNLGVEQWSQLPDNPNINCGLVIIDGLLTSVGGFNNFRFTNILLSLQGTKNIEWGDCFTPMPTPRKSAACITTKKHLIVAGGHGVNLKLNTVEVMSTTSKMWAKVASLPLKCSELTASVYQDTIYLAGDPGLSNSVLASYLPDLFSTAKTGSGKHSQSHDVWKEVSSLRVNCSTLVSLAGNLLAVGGNDESGKPTSSVYRYNLNTDSWGVVNQMKTKRSSCLGVSLETNDCLVVVGGWSLWAFRDSLTDHVEILD